MGESVNQDVALATYANKKKSRRGPDPAGQKRRCVSTACIACRRRKSKCDGAIPSCAACASVYGTECVYDPNSDHRRKGVYKEKVDSVKAQSSTLQILIEAILNAAEEDVPDIVKRIRTCDNLDSVAEAMANERRSPAESRWIDDSPAEEDEPTTDQPVEGERDLARKMGELRLENGLVRFIGGTSHLLYTGGPQEAQREPEAQGLSVDGVEPLSSWTEVTKDAQLIKHLLNMYFVWHYPYFTAMSKSLFYRDLLKGKPQRAPTKTTYCSSLLVNAMLALACHFTSVPGAFAKPGDSRTKGDHFFAEARRIVVENAEYEQPRLTTVQALAIMSVREAGCGRESRGWVYSGISFRMAQDIGLNLDAGAITAAGKGQMDDEEIDARRVTFWGCFLFDKCWSNYLGRLPQVPRSNCNVPRYDVFPGEDAEPWSPYLDSGFDTSSSPPQPSRTRAIGLQLLKISEISSDLLLFFYHPNHIGRSSGKSAELKKLSELHRRLEEWRKELPAEFEPKEGQLPNVILMHMFFHLQYIHLFRPFLRYAPAHSPLPAHVSPRRICTANAGAISKLMRLYKKTYNLRRICNIAVYMLHSACTIHLLNLPEKAAKRDIIHGVKNLEEMSEDWISARRTLSILSVLARKWNVEMPAEASVVLNRTDNKYGTFSTADVPSPSLCATVAAPKSGCDVSSAPPLPSSSLAMAAPSAATTTVVSSEMFSSQSSHCSLPPTTLALSRVETPQTCLDANPTAARLDLMGGYESASSSAHMPSPHQMQNLSPHPAEGALKMSNFDVEMPMADSPAVMNSWAMPLVSRAPQPAASAHQYSQQRPQSRQLQQQPQQGLYMPPLAAPHGGAGESSAGARGQTGAQFLSGLDGQEWFLKDGVNWQQNLEIWDLAGGGGDGVSNSNMQPTQNGQAMPELAGPPSSGVQDPSGMFMFSRGTLMQGSDGSIDSALFDSFASTMNGEYLVGLE